MVTFLEALNTEEYCTPIPVVFDGRNFHLLFSQLSFIVHISKSNQIQVSRLHDLLLFLLIYS